MAIGKDNNNSVIGPGSIFEGKFYIAGSLRIDGKFEGEIKTDDALFIGETGKVRTNISAREVIVAGTLIGNIKAEAEVRLEETGRLLGDIIAPALSLAKGVVAKGNITVTGGQKKDVKKIVEESFGGTRTLDNGKEE
ncbi:polymer-forming cytoskeletal family protein [Leptospira broomii serovar Hurstbridge str. 5399]|uniref:Polymer-forming cytoskeletal family protein n=4 Tax=Leptospira TaxID=171 RepID=V6HEH1_9LEPT|nr:MULTISPECIES: polymer-forming cytoskeletal protein [Leptospira]EPG74357.1 polymer-forming cytoskeletal family protein [Leptospira fainei serovar Hurstbridge str. BUT 6]EQA37738.1 polymer-forming cytoskeletal family protein [Leptospira inadai serovar Lyme str. 10]EQA44421.1 polymer-forming cytoskeletal family protein [Leptospira broomii serovar Hurstbridge str. 5399]PNV74701.1 polymer-forming cytoskeletal protein [Leptospira inadai serovar Lyme]